MVPDSLPELNLEEVDTTISFLGKELSLPLIINAITGGVDEALVINGSLARLAAQHGLGMAVGSQTIALDDNELANSFKIVRKENRDGLVLANIAANAKPPLALQAIEMIEADGLQIHLNIPQELAMKEGDRDFRGLLDNIAELARIAPVPIIAKEVGFGLSRETCQRLYEAGVRLFDVGGRGGTNFIAIEQARSGLFNDDFISWGLPTPASVAELSSLRFPIIIVASGGIRGGLDAAKAIALGADIVGVAGHFLKILTEQGMNALSEEIKVFQYHLKSSMMMTGAASLADLKRIPLVIGGNTAHWITTRGIDICSWACRTGRQENS